jgi:hypothetical protein
MATSITEVEYQVLSERATSSVLVLKISYWSLSL